MEDQSGDLRRGMFPDEHTFKKGRGGRLIWKYGTASTTNVM